jgi:Zinc finger, C3HC4 type (RING finger)
LRPRAAKPDPDTRRTQSVDDADEMHNRSSNRLRKEAAVDIDNETVGHLSECCMCFDRPMDSVIYRCGHMCVCYECGLEIQEFHNPPLCPICRQPISDIIKIYKA